MELRLALQRAGRSLGQAKDSFNFFFVLWCWWWQSGSSEGKENLAPADLGLDMLSRSGFGEEVALWGGVDYAMLSMLTMMLMMRMMTVMINLMAMIMMVVIIVILGMWVGVEDLCL